MSYVGKITDTAGNTGLVGSTLYGTCTTGASTAAKVVTCANFDKLIDGVTIHVKFTYSNTSTGTITLNVNSTGAKNIYKYGTTKPGNTVATSWEAGSVVSFTYDGSYWMMNDHLDDTNTQTVTSVAGKTGAVTLSASDVGALASTTKYAGASTAGGSATSAAKLDTSTAGSATQPCYFSSGVPSACTYELNKTVPSDAVFTDTKVTQTNVTDGQQYRVLFSSTGDDGTETTTVLKNSMFTYSPIYKSLTLGTDTAEGSNTTYYYYTDVTPRKVHVRSKKKPNSGSTSPYRNVDIQASGIEGKYSDTVQYELKNSAAVGANYSGSLLLTNGQSSPISLTANNTDIILSGTDNTWDGNHTSLKGALTPVVVTDSTVNLNNYTSSGKWILTGSISTKTNFPVAQPGQLEVTAWQESSSNYYCRQDFKVYNTDMYVPVLCSRIGTSSNGTSWTWNRWYSENYMLPGETLEMASGFPAYGFITTSGKEMHLYFPVYKFLNYTGGVQTMPSSISITVRQNGKYIGSSSGATTAYPKDWYRQKNIMELVVYNNSNQSSATAWTNGTNNCELVAVVNTAFNIVFK